MEIHTPSRDIPSMLADLHQALAEGHAFVRYHREAVKAGAASVGEYDRSMAVVERFATKIAELTPSAPRKPKDNAFASKRPRRRERSSGCSSRGLDVRCANCGESPYPKKPVAPSGQPATAPGPTAEVHP